MSIFALHSLFLRVLFIDYNLFQLIRIACVTADESQATLATERVKCILVTVGFVSCHPHLCIKTIHTVVDLAKCPHDTYDFCFINVSPNERLLCI